MTSKLRLNGKRTRGTATLSEKEQIQLAIQLSLQQQADRHQNVLEPKPTAGGLPDSTAKESTVAAAVAHVSAAQLAGNPRKKRTATTRRAYVVEESLSEGSSDPGCSSPRGANDYRPETSDSDGGDSDDDSDFTGEKRDDDAPCKKRKSEVSKGKKQTSQREKVASGCKKTGDGKVDRDKARGDKADRALAARPAKPPSSAWTTSGIGTRGQRAVAPVASTTIPAHIAVAPGPRPISAAAHLTSHALRLDIPEICARQGEAPGDAKNRTSTRAAHPGVLKEAKPADATNCNLTARLADEVGCIDSRTQHPCPEPDSGAARESETGVVTIVQEIPSVPTLPAKTLVLVNRMTPGPTSGSAQWKPLITASGSGGASISKTSMALPSGALQYRVPGLRRPGSSSVTKKPPSTAS